MAFPEVLDTGLTWLPLKAGIVLSLMLEATVCNASENPILTLESFFFLIFILLYIHFLNFCALLEILFYDGL